MQPVFYLVFLIAVHMSVLVDCKPRIQEPQQEEPCSFSTGTASTASLFLKLNERMTQVIHRESLVILPVRAERRNFVSIFDLRRRRFVCMDLKGERRTSRLKQSAGCLFRHVWVDVSKPHHMFYSTNGKRPLKQDGGQQPPKPPSGLLGSFLTRQRRSEETNPSDPLKSQLDPTPPAKDQQDGDPGQPEPDQAGAVSKETIPSCDDPLKVLHTNGPVSPVKASIAEQN
ncbi:uncharacterized protein LOC117514964 [Thalassophryne amazonica]|uniref:uncharacterized protein LOC117514964 n=1 Tax=Thalassophryne amazonica TaxID=390379 RepID=UPI001470C0F1|nr:uncharacterized protein LOC117514964 [Thalassophryne amazonica]